MNTYVKVNGQVQQTNQRLYHLKSSQKEQIGNLFQTLYQQQMTQRNTADKLPSRDLDKLITVVYEATGEQGIWLPYKELESFCFNKIRRTVMNYQRDKKKKRKLHQKTAKERAFPVLLAKEKDRQRYACRFFL